MTKKGYVFCLKRLWYGRRVGNLNTELFVEYLNDVEVVRDNAGMMLIKYLIDLRAHKVLLVGIDGYSIDPTQNFMDQKMNFYT